MTETFNLSTRPAIFLVERPSMSHPRPSARLALGGLACLIHLNGLAARAEAPPSSKPTITARAIRPDREVESMFRLFRGSRAANPAAALVAWKRASREPKRLGKSLEAAIAAINPRMLPEYRLLDDAALAIGFDPTSGRTSWHARFPNDDGTLGALGATGLLSGGRREPPVGEILVDRLGGAGSPLLAQGPSGLVMASSREELIAASATSRVPPNPAPIESGWLVDFDPSASETWTTLAGRRWAEAVRGTRCLAVSGRLRFEGDTLAAGVEGRFGSAPPASSAIDPKWLDFIPSRGPLAAFGFRVDPRAESWNAAFDLVDRIERADPARANVASSRIRVALAARAAGVRLEADVWPHLQGVSGWVGASHGKLDRGVFAIYFDEEAVARRLLSGIKGRRPADGPDDLVELGDVQGRPLRVIRRQNSVFVAWGERAWANSLEAIEHPGRSARPTLGSSRTGPRPNRVGAVWVDQLPRVPRDTPLASTLAESPPIRWAGWNAGDRTFDEVWVDGLDATVRRFLERIPLDPPPAL